MACKLCGGKLKLVRYVSDADYEPAYDHPPRPEWVDCECVKVKVTVKPQPPRPTRPMRPPKTEPLKDAPPPSFPMRRPKGELPN